MVDLFQVIIKVIVVDSQNGLVLYHAGYGNVNHADYDFVGLLQLLMKILFEDMIQGYVCFPTIKFTKQVLPRPTELHHLKTESQLTASLVLCPGAHDSLLLFYLDSRLLEGTTCKTRHIQKLYFVISHKNLPILYCRTLFCILFSVTFFLSELCCSILTKMPIFFAFIFFLSRTLSPILF